MKTPAKKRRVLVACEYSGTVRDAFARRGWEAWSCDLLPTEAPGNHVQGDALGIIGDGWDLIIAHPPCTFLNVAGIHWNNRGRGWERTEAALDFVRKLLDAPAPFLALENPVSIISTRIRKPSQIVQPYNFGHDASKKTALWLKGLPPLSPTLYVPPRLVCCGQTLADGVGVWVCPNCNGEKRARPRWANQTDSGQNKTGPSPTRWKTRSLTYRGLADAMADQWSRFIQAAGRKVFCPQ